MTATLLDRAIAAFSPTRGLKRVQARAALEALADMTRRYEGASRGRRTAGWRTNAASANTITAADLALLRDRSRDLERNNPWAKQGIRVIENGVVAAGIVPQVRGGGRSKAAKRRRQNIEARWADWADSALCDASGMNNLYGIQALATRTMAIAGEVLVRRRWRNDRGLPAPLQLEVLEPDYIDSLKDGQRAGTASGLVQGIAHDADGRRTAYHLFADHPGDVGSFRSHMSSPVPAEEISHVYRVERPGQVRGVPWLSAVLLRLRDYDDFDDAELLRQKIAACFAAFVTTDSGGASNTLTKPDEHESLEPGAIKYLRPGETVEFGSPPPVQGLDPYAMWQLRAIAAGLGITYEALTGDLSRINFSSGRMGKLQMEAEFRAHRRLLTLRLLDRIAGWFFQGLQMQGEDTRGLWMSWTPPRREPIDPGKEVRADREEIESGLASWSEKVRQRGFDPEDLLDEIEEERGELASRGVVFTALPGSAPAPATGGATAANGTGAAENEV